MFKMCSKCNADKNITEFRKDKTKSDGVQSFCKQCARQHHKSVYNERYGEKSRMRVKSRVDANRALLFEYKSRQQCACCDEKDVVCLEFHHPDPSKKEFQVANNLCANWNRILAEIQKCIVLCSNCHKKVHAGRINIPVD